MYKEGGGVSFSVKSYSGRHNQGLDNFFLEKLRKTLTLWNTCCVSGFRLDNLQI